MAFGAVYGKGYLDRYLKPTPGYFDRLESTQGSVWFRISRGVKGWVLASSAMGVYNPINQVDREYGEGSGGGRGGGGRGSGSSGIQVNPNKRVYGFGDLSSGGEGQNSDNKNGTAQETPSHVRTHFTPYFSYYCIYIIDYVILFIRYLCVILLILLLYTYLYSQFTGHGQRLDQAPGSGPLSFLNPLTPDPPVTGAMSREALAARRMQALGVPLTSSGGTEKVQARSPLESV